MLFFLFEEVHLLRSLPESQYLSRWQRKCKERKRDGNRCLFSVISCESKYTVMHIEVVFGNYKTGSFNSPDCLILWRRNNSIETCTGKS